MKILTFFVCLLAVAPVFMQTTLQPTTTYTTVAELTTTNMETLSTSVKAANASTKMINGWISVLSDADKSILKLLQMKDDFNATRDVAFVLYTPLNPIRGQTLSTSSLNSSNFNPAYSTRIIIHGWLNVVDSPVNILVKDAYLKKGNFNVICVNWDNGSDELDDILVWSRLPSAAVEVFKLLKVLVASNYVRTNDLLLAGHSLGAHMCGLIGKLMPGIRAIVGLDPADPLFYKSLPERRLNSTDALAVHVLHTSRLGLQYKVGTADFFADKGFSQPGCDVTATSCSHSRAYLYFAESIIGPNKFISTKCSSMSSYVFNFFGLCEKSSQFLFGGEPLYESLIGSYYFEVDDTFPYGLG